jgi:uncharacterized membrane protein
VPALPADRPPRLLGLDAARGAALVAMIAYHVVWDLSLFGLVPVDVAVAPGWRHFAQGIAACFLVIAGISLSLAARAGAGLWRSLRRIGIITAAAGAVSAATYAVFPGQGVYFGILHCIALASLLALPLRRVPAGLLLALAVLAGVAPLLWTSPRFDSWAWYWLGLSAAVPPAPDYVPLLPWAAAMLVGMAIGRWLPAPRRAAASSPVIALLAAAGRRSLVIYLLHQPVLFGVVFALVWLGKVLGGVLR